MFTRRTVVVLEILLAKTSFAYQNARIKDVSRFCHGNHKRSKQENRLEVILGVVDALNHQQTIVAL